LPHNNVHGGHGLKGRVTLPKASQLPPYILHESLQGMQTLPQGQPHRTPSAHPAFTLHSLSLSYPKWEKYTEKGYNWNLFT